MSVTPPQAVLVDFVRTPFAKAVDPSSGKNKQGKLAHVLPDDMVVTLIRSLLERTQVNPDHIETLLLGCVHQEAEQGLNLARLIVLNPDSGLPHSVGGVTLDRFCGSSMHAIADGKNAIQAGEADVVLCAGVQSMSRIPVAGWNPMLNPKVYDGQAKGFMNMGITAENLARQYHVDRGAQETFAVQSHHKAAQAKTKGYFQQELIPMAGLDHDDNVRPETSVEQMAGLKPAFEKEGSITAATSSPITDGASAVLLTSEAYAREHHLSIMARLGPFAGSGCAPEVMGIGPVESSKKALSRAGLTMAEMGVVEMNEAFAAQCLSVLQEMTQQGMEIPLEKLNMDGGAIALGHPFGASGARIVGKAAQLLHRTQERYALATMCIGGGQGAAIILENPNLKD